MLADYADQTTYADFSEFSTQQPSESTHDVTRLELGEECEIGYDHGLAEDLPAGLRKTVSRIH